MNYDNDDAWQYDASWHAVGGGVKGGGREWSERGVEQEMKEQTSKATRKKSPMSMHRTSKPCHIDKTPKPRTAEAEL